MKTSATYLLLSLLITTAAQAGKPHAAQSDQTQIVITIVQARYLDVYEALRSAIVGHSLTIAHTIDAAEVLAASQDRYGDEIAIYRHAHNIQFCSARLSHQLVQAKPEWLSLCPFSLSVYELNQRPGLVFISYRNPETVQAAHNAVLEQVSKLHQSIIRDATLWFPPLKPEAQTRP